MANEYRTEKTESFSITHFLVRLVVGAIVLAVTAALTPGFTVRGFWPLIFGAIILAVMDYFAAKLFGIDASPFGRGIAGFILAAVIIYATQFFVAGYQVTILGAIIGALVYGLVDMIMPGRAM